jgi:hypothetical protein
MHCIFYKLHQDDVGSCQYDVILPKGANEGGNEPTFGMNINDITTYCQTANFDQCPRYIALMKYHAIKHNATNVP